MEPNFVIAGHLQRDYLLPAFNQPLLDVPGGDLLYAAGGLLVWEKGAGLLARAGEDFPRQWLQNFNGHGLDTSGIHILPEPMDLRNFIAYDHHFVQQNNNPVAHFARLGLPFPRSLLGYQLNSPGEKPAEEVAVSSPRPVDIPPGYLHTHQVLFCGMEYPTTSRLVSAFRESQVTTLVVDPLPGWMQASRWNDVRLILNGLTAFLPSEQDLRSLFWGRSDDLVEMVEAVASEQCELVVVKCGSKGQVLYDGVSHKCWQIPAYPVELVDPTGAGASFCGGFLAGYQQTYDPLQAVLFGNISASLAIEGSGAFHHLGNHPGLANARLKSLQGLVRVL
jgi:hypothetical protein